MLRLPILILATLAIMLAAMAIFGSGSRYRPEIATPAPAPIVDAVAPPAADPSPADAAAPESGPAAERALIEGSTAEAADPAPAPAAATRPRPNFAGPPLVPSPEYGGGPTPGAPSSTATPATVAAAAPADAEALYVTANNLNLRSGPDGGADVVTRLPQGTAVTPLGPSSDGWTQVQDPVSGATGYASSQYLSANAP
ncbi:SH3 domain-containing protein [Paracoccus pacificus]|uniref:SH3 domain-containing protein n=1 Tax=Paracoccus pacificus TaxID=1463598 RepID=A0ABW4RBZ6_9RHOB